LFKLLNKYRPETKAAKRQRLLKIAEAKKEGKDKEATAAKKPNVVKYGINHITALVEQKKAKLVIIAHDVDPIEVKWQIFFSFLIDVVDCSMASYPLSQNGCTLLHCERKGTFGSCSEP
jgi:hypothetical protein